MEAALENAGIPRLKTPVFERTAFKRASFSRVAPIFEDPNGGAAVNMQAVYAEVKRHPQKLWQRYGSSREMVGKLVPPKLEPINEPNAAGQRR